MVLHLDACFAPIRHPAGEDYAHLLWTMWFFKKSLLDIHSLYFTKYLFYPKGSSLVFHTLMPFDSIISIPLQETIGLVASYNLIYLAGLVLSGVGAYQLAYYLTNNSRAALVAGFIFAFNTLHLDEYTQINVFSIQWLPFFCLFIFKLHKFGNAKDAVIAALFLALASLCEWNQMVFLLLFMVFFSFYALITHTYKKSFFANLFITLIVFLVIVTPFAYPLVKELVIGSFSYKIPIQGARHGELFGEAFTYSTGIVFFNWALITGYSASVLAILSGYWIRKKEVLFWWIFTVFFFLLLLGPRLVLNGVEYKNIPLPWHLLYQIPIINGVRLPIRYWPMYMLGISVLAGYGVLIFEEKLASRRGSWLTVACLGLMLFEYSGIPFKIYCHTPSPFYNILKKDKNDFALVEVPLYGPYEGLFMYYQTIHNKKLVNGYISRIPPEALRFANNNRFLYAMNSSRLAGFRQWFPQVTRADIDALDRNGIKYVIVDRTMLTQRDLQNVPTLSIKDRFMPFPLNKTFKWLELRKGDNSYFPNDQDFQNFMGKLQDLLGKPFYVGKELTVFKLH